MIPTQQTTYEVHSNTTGEELAFSVKSLANIFELLHKSMYNDKPTAVAREIISNAIDATLEANSKKKIIIKFPTKFNPIFSVQDFGIGIDKERLKCFTEYGNTTKKHTNKEIGCFGLGAKSPWSITDQFTITTITNGIKYKYLCYMDEQGIGKVKELFSIPTDECNGTTIEIPVTNSDYIERIERQARLFWYCNQDKIIIDGDEFDIYETIQHIVSIRGFLPSNYHVFNWEEFNSSIIILNGYVPYLYSHIRTNESGFNKNYTFVVKYDIGVLDFPATREIISDTPKNNKILNKIVPTIEKARQKIFDFLVERKKHNEKLGAITHFNSPVRIPEVRIHYSDVHSIYHKNNFNNVYKSSTKYTEPTSPTAHSISNQIVVDLDNSKKYGVSYENYAQHIFDLNPKITDLYFVRGVSDEQKQQFDIIPLHCFSPTQPKREVIRKPKDEIEKENIKNRYEILNSSHEYVTLEDILKEPEKYRKIECLRNDIICPIIKKHMINLNNLKCDCNYKIIKVNKTDIRFFKKVKNVEETDFVLSKHIYKRLISAKMLRFLSSALLKTKFKIRLFDEIHSFLRENCDFPSNNPFFSFSWYTNSRIIINKTAIKNNVLYDIDQSYYKDKLKKGYKCIHDMLQMLNDSSYLLVIIGNILKSDIETGYKNQICKIFDEIKEI